MDDVVGVNPLDGLVYPKIFQVVACVHAPLRFRHLGLDIKPIGHAPDGLNVHQEFPLQVIRQRPGFITEVGFDLTVILLDKPFPEACGNGKKNQKNDQYKHRAHKPSDNKAGTGFGFCHSVLQIVKRQAEQV